MFQIRAHPSGVSLARLASVDSLPAFHAAHSQQSLAGSARSLQYPAPRAVSWYLQHSVRSDLLTCIQPRVGTHRPVSLQVQ